MPKRVNYRKLAFEHYLPICAYCGFGIGAVLEVCHLDGDRDNKGFLLAEIAFMWDL